ncbi:IclR family transcriptional regulator [Fodinicurvata halophila]|uniref:IclR family transcriptional regulator n=1 Tax=Fodinicurvata halophila TaxID=1419723 RepID=A0ABV8UL64_9PROT
MAHDSAKAPSEDVPAPPSQAGAERNPLFITALARGLHVLEVFSNGWEAMGLSEIANATGLAVPTVQRAVHTLTEMGYLAKDAQTRRYRLTPKALDSTYRYLQSSPLYEAAIPVVVALRDEWQETVNVSILDGPEAMLLIRMPGARRINPTSMIGRRMPAHATSTGLAMLAMLPPAEQRRRLHEAPLTAMTAQTVTDPEVLEKRLQVVRRDGYALVNEEAADGEISVAAPILDHDGRLVAAISMTTAVSHWSEEEARKQIAPAVKHAARAITDSLRGWRSK